MTHNTLQKQLIIKNIGVIILAGGKSSRMGQDKGMMNFDGAPMVKSIIHTAKKITDHIIIIANNPEYNQFNYPVYQDKVKDIGPIGGIYTGLLHSNFDKNIILSCDSPFVNPALLKFLVDNSDDHDVTVPVNQGRSHQLIGIYSKNCLQILKNQIELGKYRIRDAFDLMNVNLLDADHFDSKIFSNINTIEDFNVK